MKGSEHPPRTAARTWITPGALHFLATNVLIPRRAATRFLGWLARQRHPWLARPAIAVWRVCCGVDLSDAKLAHFATLREAFVRELRAGARPVDGRGHVLASPCDAIVGAIGRVQAGHAIQAKGMPYRLEELLGSAEEAHAAEGGTYITLRLTAGLYHRFHAPHAAVVDQVRYLAGDCWNVHPAALARVPRLFCRNERAAIRLRLRAEPAADHAASSGAPAAADGEPVLTLVAVAAVGVASIQLHALGGTVRTRQALRRRPGVAVARGEELGWFEHGSTILVFAPPGFAPAPGVLPGAALRAGEAMLERVPARAAASVPAPNTDDPDEPSRPAATMRHR
jgi:phosphatidylserine decarboxylase